MSPAVSIRLLRTLSDARLVSLAAAGHERAFEAIVHRYRRDLLAYSRRLVTSEARGEDAVQQALLQAWLALQRDIEVRDLKSWLYRIVRNTALNMQRGAAGQEFAQLPQDARSSRPGPEAWIAISTVLSDLAALPGLQRQVLLRMSLEGETHDEIAAALGLSTGAVRGLIYRARTSLRAASSAMIPAPVLHWMLGGGAAGLGARDQIARWVTSAPGMSAATGGGAVLAGVSVVLAGGAALPGVAPYASHHAHVTHPAAHVRRGSVVAAPGLGDTVSATTVLAGGALPRSSPAPRGDHPTRVLVSTSSDPGRRSSGGGPGGSDSAETAGSSEGRGNRGSNTGSGPNSGPGSGGHGAGIASDGDRSSGAQQDQGAAQSPSAGLAGTSDHESGHGSEGPSPGHGGNSSG